MDLLKHGEDSYRVHGSDQTAEEEILQQTDVQVTCRTQGRTKSEDGFYLTELSEKLEAF